MEPDEVIFLCIYRLLIKKFKEEKRSLNEFQEKFGIERLWDILSTVNWPQKILKKDSILTTKIYLNEIEPETSYSTNNTIKKTEATSLENLNECKMNNLNLKDMDLDSTIQLFNKVKIVDNKIFIICF